MFTPEHIGLFVVLLLIALVVFGGSRLGGVGGSLGKSIREFRREVRSDSDTTDSSGTTT
jgi:sec-independent protein translocase protein TatA